MKSGDTRLKVCIAGATGSVGRALVEAIAQADDLILVGAVARRHAGASLSEIVGEAGADVSVSATVAEALATPADVFVDYTSAAAVRGNVLAAIRWGVPTVIGASGLDESDYAEIDREARTRELGVFAAGNFAITAVLMQRFAVIAARYVPYWEIIDYGDAEKIDAPSGTTRETASRLAGSRATRAGQPIEETVGIVAARGATVEGSQTHSVRLPGFISSAEVIFGMAGERLSIRHDSIDGALPYVAGTLLAVRKVRGLIGLVRGLDQLLELS